MIYCNCCGSPIDDGDICDKCSDAGKMGTYCMCVKCNKISFTCTLREDGTIKYAENGGDFKRRYFTVGCRNCDKSFTPFDLQMYTSEEDALSQLTK